MSECYAVWVAFQILQHGAEAVPSHMLPETVEELWALANLEITQHALDCGLMDPCSGLDFGLVEEGDTLAPECDQNE